MTKIKNYLLKLNDLFYEFRKHLTILINKLLSKIVKPPTVRKTDETLNKVIFEKSSVSRYGDGEFKIMFKGEQFFQEYDKELRSRLIEIIRSRSDNHIVCIPDVFCDPVRFTDRARDYWNSFMNLNRSKIYRKLDMNKIYYDAMMTRLYMDYKDKSKAVERFTKFRMIWNERDVVLVEGELSRLGAGNNLFRNVKSLKRILCPAENAFSKYAEILSQVKKHDTSKLILLALGPTATVLAYDLSKIGYQAVDIGNVDIEYEWFLKQSMVKTAVKNKYTGEAPNGTQVEKLQSLEYENEIQVQIK
jgi:glycosyltransferase family protein